MIRKIKQWWKLRKQPKLNLSLMHEPSEPLSFTRDQLENAYKLGYNDGKRDGLSIAREQATKSLKEILWQQNQKQPRK